MARKALASAISGGDSGLDHKTQQTTQRPDSSQLLYHDTDIGQQC